MKKMNANQQWDRIATQLEHAVLQMTDGELLAEPNAGQCADHVKAVVFNAVVESRRKVPRTLADFLNRETSTRKLLNTISSSDISYSAAFSDEDEAESAQDDEDSPPRSKKR